MHLVKDLDGSRAAIILPMAVRAVPVLTCIFACRRKSRSILHMHN